MGKVRISKSSVEEGGRPKPVAAKAGLSKDPRRRYGKGGKVKKKSS